MRFPLLAFGLALALLASAVAFPIAHQIGYASHRLSCYGVAPNGNDFLPGAECHPRAH